MLDFPTLETPVSLKPPSGPRRRTIVTLELSRMEVKEVVILRLFVRGVFSTYNTYNLLDDTLYTDGGITC